MLGFDTATHATAVGLMLGDQRFLQASDDPPPKAHPGHATRLLGMADGLLREAGIHWGELDRIAVGLGPGRFTGLRVGLATARGLAQSLGIELAGVSTLWALAEAAARAREGAGRLLAVVDARRGELFAAAFSNTSAGLAPAGGELGVSNGARLLRPLRPADLAALLADRPDAPGPELPWLALGDGAVLARPELEAAGAEVPADDSRLHRVSGNAVCELGARATPSESLERVLPDYRRPADVREGAADPPMPAMAVAGAVSAR